MGGGEAEEVDQLGGEGGTGAHTGELIQGKGLLHNLECFPKHHWIMSCWHQWKQKNFNHFCQESAKIHENTLNQWSKYELYVFRNKSVHSSILFFLCKSLVSIVYYLWFSLVTFCYLLLLLLFLHLLLFLVGVVWTICSCSNPMRSIFLKVWKPGN